MANRLPLFELLKNCEADPTEQDGWVSRAVSSGSGTTLEKITKASVHQEVSMSESPIGLSEFVYLIGSTQVGKTLGFMSVLMETAHTSEVAPVILSMNSVAECDRFISSSVNINGIVSELGLSIGMNVSEIPQLRIYDFRSVRAYKTALDSWLKKEVIEIPVYLMMANSMKTCQFKKTILPFLNEKCGVDSSGRKKTMMVVDEADLLYKSEDMTSKLEASMFSGEIHDTFSTVVYVTASPQSFAINTVPVNGRKITVLEVHPSDNNWQYHHIVGSNAKLITRRLADSPTDMVDNMLEDTGTRVALVTTTEKSNIAWRRQKAISLTNSKIDVKGFVSFSWSSGKIEVFTGDRSWAQFFHRCPHLSSRRVNAKLCVFTGCKVINSYPKIISYILANDRPEGNVKFVLFAKMMAERAVPIKGECHGLPLTDMYFDSKSMHHEGMIQSMGRLCGLDKSGVIKNLWASSVVHERHIKALDEVGYVIKSFLPFGKSAIDALETIQKTVFDLTEDEVVEIKTVEDVDNAVEMVNSRMSRPGSNKRARVEKAETKSCVRDKKLKLSKPSFKSEYLHTLVPEYLEEYDEDSCEGEGDMKEALNECKIGILDSIVKLVKESAFVGKDGKKVLPFTKMADILSAEDSYPDGVNFSRIKFVRFIAKSCTEELNPMGIRVSTSKFSAL